MISCEIFGNSVQGFYEARTKRSIEAYGKIFRSFLKNMTSTVRVRLTQLWSKGKNIENKNVDNKNEGVGGNVRV
jgi:hypothetical protein